MTAKMQIVMHDTIMMAGTCDACGAPWRATGTKQGGMNDSERVICPACREPTGATMHCAFGPFVERDQPDAAA